MRKTQSSGMYEMYIPEYAPPVAYETHAKALEVACFFQNKYVELTARCNDLEEIVEQFCMDAEGTQP